jgi:Holliday junction DNA helicase RuvA
MIGRISGQLLEKLPPQIVVEVAAGVGYELDVPMSTFYQLPALGQPISLFTHFVVREDAQLLYGFATLAERAVFRQLIKVTGVGAKMALALLSGMDASELAHAVAHQDFARLVRIPGVGRKTAERLVLELRGKLTEVGSSAVPAAAIRGVSDEVYDALLALGYSEREASAAIRQPDVSLNVENGIRAALKWLSRS